jgi:hypothetical protein
VKGEGGSAPEAVGSGFLKTAGHWHAQPKKKMVSFLDVMEALMYHFITKSIT